MEPLLERFLKVLRLKVAATTYTRKAWQIKAFFAYLQRIGKSYAEVNQTDLEQYLLSLNGTRRQHRQAMCCTIREFYQFIKVPENPAAKIEFKPDTSRKLFTVPSQHAIEEFFTRLSSLSPRFAYRNRLMAELIYGSGLRRSEIVGVDIEDIDLTEGTIQVTGKGNKTRNVPLTGKSLSLIREYLSERQVYRGPLFKSQYKRRISKQAVYAVLNNRAGIRPHLLRHACATHMLTNGCNIRVIQELLGHQRLTSTMIYTHINKEQLREVLTAKHPRRGL